MNKVTGLMILQWCISDNGSGCFYVNSYFFSHFYENIIHWKDKSENLQSRLIHLPSRQLSSVKLPDDKLLGLKMRFCLRLILIFENPHSLYWEQYLMFLLSNEIYWTFYSNSINCNSQERLVSNEWILKKR